MTSNTRRPLSSNAKRSHKDSLSEENVKLDRVLGFTTQSNSSLTYDFHAELLAYPASSVVVVYDLKTNKQRCFLPSSARKSITAVEFSKDGKYLATGEAGHKPCVRIWNVEDQCVLGEYSGHGFRVNCLAFNSSSRYLVSVGNQDDMMINIWDRVKNTKVASSKVSSKVNAVAFSETENFFVTVGSRHFRYWYMEINRTRAKEVIPLKGHNAILGELMNNNFVDVSCCTLTDSCGHNRTFVYVISTSGQLCKFNEQRSLEINVFVNASQSTCLSLTKEYVAVGSSNGIIQLFYTDSLEQCITLPKPHPIGGNLKNSPTTNWEDDENQSYADVLAVRFYSNQKRIVAFYNDHSVYIWDIADLDNISCPQYHNYHSGSIWSVIPGPGKESDQDDDSVDFLTCSEDDTVKLWKLPHRNTEYQSPTEGNRQDLFDVIYTDPSCVYLLDCDQKCASTALIDKADTSAKHGITCIALNSTGSHLATGDKSGCIRIYESNSLKEIYGFEAHSSDVLTLHYFQSPSVPELELLTSGSRDRLIHIFDPNQSYALIQTSEEHSGAIYGAKIIETPDREVRLVSSGLDKSFLIRMLQPDISGETANFVLEHTIACKTGVHDLAEATVYSPSGSRKHFAVLACADRRLRIYNVMTGQARRLNKAGEDSFHIHGDGPLVKCQVDPSSNLIAVASQDRKLYLINLTTMELLATFSAHAELVTGVCFLKDSMHVVSVGGDGCIFLWKVSDKVVLNVLNKSPSPGYCSRQSTSSSDIFLDSPVRDTQSPVRSAPYRVLPPPATKGFKFSVSSLPAWAQRNMVPCSEETSNAEDLEVEDEELEEHQDKEENNNTLTGNMPGPEGDHNIPSPVPMSSSMLANPSMTQSVYPEQISELMFTSAPPVLQNDQEAMVASWLTDNSEVFAEENEETVVKPTQKNWKPPLTKKFSGPIQAVKLDSERKTSLPKAAVNYSTSNLTDDKAKPSNMTPSQAKSMTVLNLRKAKFLSIAKIQFNKNNHNALVNAGRTRPRKTRKAAKPNSNNPSANNTPNKNVKANPRGATNNNTGRPPAPSNTKEEPVKQPPKQVNDGDAESSDPVKTLGSQLNLKGANKKSYQMQTASSMRKMRDGDHDASVSESKGDHVPVSKPMVGGQLKRKEKTRSQSTASAHLDNAKRDTALFFSDAEDISNSEYDMAAKSHVKGEVPANTPESMHPDYRSRNSRPRSRNDVLMVEAKSTCSSNTTLNVLEDESCGSEDNVSRDHITYEYSNKTVRRSKSDRSTNSNKKYFVPYANTDQSACQKPFIARNANNQVPRQIMCHYPVNRMLEGKESTSRPFSQISDAQNSEDSDLLTLTSAIDQIREAITCVVEASSYATEEQLRDLRPSLCQIDGQLSVLKLRCNVPQTFMSEDVANNLVREFGERLCSEFHKTISSYQLTPP